MTTIDPTAAATPASTGSPSALSQLSGNFDTFLHLLTTQLQNQDPTSPMDTNQFTQQLVEFSQVEQQISTNSNLKTLIGLAQGRSTSDAVNYLGKTVVLTNGKSLLSNGAANWTYALDANTATTTLTVSNENGKVVYVGQGEKGSGAHKFAWNGQDNAGNTLPDGTYKLTVTATAADGSPIGSKIASTGTVSQIDLTGSVPQLMIGSMEFPMSDVSAVASL
jgi:flagellar basal-body rod modification protein FlgD